MSSNFKTEVSDGVHLISLPSNLTTFMASELEAEVKSWLLQPHELHIFDFKGVLHIDPALNRIFATFKSSLKEHKKHLASVNISPALLQDMKSAAITGLFMPAASINEARRSAGMVVANRPKLNVEYIEPFVTATLTTMKTQISLEVTCGKPYLKSEQLPTEIAGVISLNNSDLPGTIAICFTKDVFLGIYEMMVGEKHQDITSEIQDAAGEILNIIFGQAKTALLAKGVRLERAIPVVLAGQQLKLQFGKTGTGSGSMILPFQSKLGPFHIEVVLG